MLRFTVRRLLLLIPILFGLSLLLFAWVRALPGGPAQALLGERATPESIAQIEESFGLNRPWPIQYLDYLNRLLHGDLGTSTQTNRPVTTELIERFPATVELTVAAMLFAVLLGVPLGYYAARKHGRAFDHLSVGGSLVGVAIPIFVLGYILKLIFGVKLGWLPTSGRADPRLTAEHPTNFYVLDGLVTGNPQASWDAIKHLILPAIALGCIPLAIILRITRAATLDVVHDDYVRTAEAKGLTKQVVDRRHILRNAMLPVVTIIGLQVGLLLSGAVLTETVFALPGIGSFLVKAILVRDYSTIQGFTLFIAVLYVMVNLLVDISYGVLDPRVRVTS